MHEGECRPDASCCVQKVGCCEGSRASVSDTLATELSGRGASFEDGADVLGNSPEIVRKYYAKWSPASQARIDDLMQKVHAGSRYVENRKTGRESQTIQ
jgi:predicted transcriptional regulator